MNEPKTTFNLNDLTVGYGADPADNRLNILCPIISPSGPTELTRISGPSALKRLYFGGRSITANDHYSAVFARALSANAPLYIKRGTRNKLRGGKSSFLASPIYTDFNYSVVSGKKVDFTVVPPASQTYEDLVSALVYTVTDTSVYSTSTIPASEIVRESTKIESELTTKLAITGTTVNDVTFTIGNSQYFIPSGTEDLNDVVESLFLNGVGPQIVMGSSGPIRVEFRDGVVSIPDGAKVTELHWVADLSISFSYRDDKIVESSESVTVYFARIKSEKEFIDEYPVSAVVKVGFSGTVYALYTGDYTPSTGEIVVDLGNNLTFFKFMESLIKNVASMFGGDSGSETSVLIPEASSVSVSPIGQATTLTASVSSLSTAQFNDKFAVLAAFPCDTDCIDVSISISDEYKNSYVVNASYSSGSSESWVISFDSGMIDGYGNSLYYQRVNEESQLIRIVELQGENVSAQSFKIGAQVSSSYSGVDEIIAAYEEMMETDESPVMFDIITDGGIYDVSLAKFIKAPSTGMCAKYHAFYPISTRVDKVLNEKEIRKMRSDLEDSYYSNFIPHTERGAFLDSGSAVYPASYYYLARRISLANTTLEFVAMFGQDYGNIGMQNPREKFTTAVREDLLDVQVPTLKRESTGLYCLNTNFTTYSQSSYLQEDGIMMMVNKISQIADTYGKSLLGHYNTSSLRANVVDTLTRSISDRMRVGTDYGPVAIVVQCDSNNNPEYLERQHKLRIDIYGRFANSIREVLIYSNVLPLQ